MDDADRHAPRSAYRSLAWLLVLVVGSLGFSLGFACATPFAALGAIAGMQLRLREALGAALLAWLGNQAIGFLMLHYPRTWDSFAWGGAIGVAAVLAALAAAASVALMTRPVVRVLVAFAAAFLVYEGAILVAGWMLPSEADAMAPWIVARILEINAVAYVGLLTLHRLAVGIGLLKPATQPRSIAYGGAT